METPQLRTYRQKPVDVKAFRWTTDMGQGGGVNERPKKHPSNPDEFFVKNRFNKEIIITEPCWVTTNRDGSHDVIADSQFLELWQEVPETAPLKPVDSQPKPEKESKRGRRRRTSNGLLGRVHNAPGG